MKPFDLEAALRGEPLVTRDGRKAKFVAYVPEVDGCKFIAFVESQRSVIAYYDNGGYYDFKDDDIDLFMYEPTLTLAGIKFPEPLRSGVENGQEFWLVDITHLAVEAHKWTGSFSQFNWLKTGLIQSTKEGAEQQLQAMIRSVGGEYEYML